MLFRKAVTFLSLIGLLLNLLFSLPAMAAPNETFRDSLWVAGVEKVWKKYFDGNQEDFSLKDSELQATFALDPVRGVIWSYGNHKLSAYEFSGERIFVRDLEELGLTFDNIEEELNDPSADEWITKCTGYGPSLDDYVTSVEDKLINSLADGVDSQGVLRSNFWSRLAVDNSDGSAWLGLGNDLLKFNKTGQLLFRKELDYRVHSIDFDQDDRTLWVGSSQNLLILGSSTLRAIDQLGNVQSQVELYGTLCDVAYANPTDELWVAVDSGLARRKDGESSFLLTELPYTPHMVEPSSDGGAWVVSGPRVHRIDQHGTEVFVTYPFGEYEAVIVADNDWQDDSVWVASRLEARTIRSNGTVESEADLPALVDTVLTLSFYTDLYPPAVEFFAPQAGTLLNNSQPVLDLIYEDVGIGANPSSLAFTVDGYGKEFDCNAGTQSASCTPVTDLPEGVVRLGATIEDYDGNGSSEASLSLSIDTVPPSALSPTDISIDEVNNGLVYLSVQPGSAEAGANFKIKNQDTGAQTSGEVLADGSFKVSVPASSGETLVLWLVDKAGNSSDSTAKTLTFGSAAPSPEEAAPLVDETTPFNMYNATSFLFEGDTAVQFGVSDGAIDPERLAVIRGRVLDRDNQPLADVRVAIEGQPEYGATLTRSDGYFDLAVNGGTSLTVSYEKEGLLPAHRQLTPPTEDFTTADDVVLVELDPVVTEVVLGDSSSFQIASSSQVSDASGERSATLMFPAGTSGSMVLPDGSTKTLDTVNVRATEYTVGPNGPKAMPAELPSTSGYTYAVELSLDEAINADATRVEFTQPIVSYVDNFLDFPVGDPVPAGYYDRKKAAWVPASNGRVIEILSIQNGLAEVDLSGDGVAATQTELDAFGFSSAELESLGAKYVAGDSLWRVQVSHFTPWDYNWPYGPPDDATEPEIPEDKEDEEDEPCEKSGSIVECENRVLGETIPLVGTDLSLNYRSDRVPGRKEAYSLDIPVSGAELPASLKEIVVKVSVAGQEYREVLPASTNQRFQYAWDGLDAYGRSVGDEAVATVRVGYVYPGVYYAPDEFEEAFGLSGRARYTGNPTRTTVTKWSTEKYQLGIVEPVSTSVGSWSLTGHHHYSSLLKRMEKGNGVTVSGAGTIAGIQTVLGKGAYGLDGVYYYPPTGASGKEANLGLPRDIVFGSDGYLYVFDSSEDVIIKYDVKNDMILDYIDTPWNNYFLEVGPKGDLYAGSSCTIMKWDDAQEYWVHIAGSRDGECGYSGDGGPAKNALFGRIWGVEINPEGAIYVADTSNNRIRKISSSGIVTTIAGTGEDGRSGDGGRAKEAMVSSPGDLTLDSHGNLFFEEDYTIRRISPEGIITTVVGTGVFGDKWEVDGQNADQTDLPGWINGVAVRNDRLYFSISEYNKYEVRSSILYLDSAGKIRTFVGRGPTPQTELNGDEGFPRLEAKLYNAHGMTWDDEGRFYFADFYNGRVARIESMPSMDGVAFEISSNTGNQVYRFNSDGRHISTLNSLNGEIIHKFHYTDEGLLQSVEVLSGDVTTIERDSRGKPVAIIAPDGQKTLLEVNANGYLSGVTNPNGETYTMSYTADGLLTAFSKPKGNTTTMTYDAMGYLASTLNPDQVGGWDLSRTNADDGSYSASITSGEGRTTSYQSNDLANGARKRTITAPDGTSNQIVHNDDGTETTTYADGTVVTTKLGPDPRLGMSSPVVESRTVQTPGGLTSVLSQTHDASIEDGGDWSDLITLNNSSDRNGNVSTENYDASIRTWTQQSAEGRETSTVLNDILLPATIKRPGLADIGFQYDARHRLVEESQTGAAETRAYSFAYHSSGSEAGMLSEIVDPLGRSVRFDYDPAGRVVEKTLVDGRSIGFQWDSNGNMTALTTPSGSTHVFRFNELDLRDQYDPPQIDAGSTVMAYSFNLDKQLSQVERPGGETVTYTYDSGGRLASQTLPIGTYDYDYESTTGQLSTITALASNTLTYTYDGFLPLSESWSGEIAGTVDRTYDSNFWVTSLAVGGVSVSYGYDQDGLLTQAGNLTLQRDTLNGLLTGTELGLVSTSQVHNDFAELAFYKADVSSSVLFEESYTRDALGRITSKTEQIGGIATTYQYDYDAAGRLAMVQEDGVTTDSYQYDTNGNRLSHNGTEGSYDEQDRLVTYGGASYNYTLSGELASKAENGVITSYDYDVLGNLRQVQLPGDITIDYVIDGRNRRIGKKVNGELVQGFLYQDQLNPVAELDGLGNIVAQFIYSDRPNVPSHMIKEGATYRIISDHLGSPRLVVNTADGTVVQRIDYDPFGTIIADTNPGFQPFGFAGGIYDQHSRFVRFGARDFDPEIGRWTSKDPIRFAGGQLNLYGYTNNDPVNWTDPWGLQSIDVAQHFGFATGQIPTTQVQVENMNNLPDNMNLLPKYGSAAAAVGSLAPGGAVAVRICKVIAKNPDAFADAIMEFAEAIEGGPTDESKINKLGNAYTNQISEISTRGEASGVDITTIRPSR